MQSMHSTAPRAARGFSLVEMLLAVFILGIGVISIAALFPAGISLQRQATDDVVGPIVAKNALATLRSKLSQDDFGGYSDFGLVPTYIGPYIAGSVQTSGGQFIEQLNGDWAWMRPGFVFDSPSTPQDESAIDIFSAGYTRRQGQPAMPPFLTGAVYATETPDGVPTADPYLFGIPYNPKKYSLFANRAANSSLSPVAQHVIEPLFTFTQAERSWPQGPANYGPPTSSGVVPQYYWDCMFRRNGGRVQVAVFVYRVTAPGGEVRPYSVAKADPVLIGNAAAGGQLLSDLRMPPMPLVFLAPNFGLSSSWPNRTTNDLRLLDEIPNTGPGSTMSFTAGKTWDDWMAPGAVWVDNHANVHRVLRGRLFGAATGASGLPNVGPVKLQRQIPIMPYAPTYGFVPTPTPPNDYKPVPAPPIAGGRATGPNGWIEAIWFIPNADRFGNVITPVYATVEEL